MTYNRPTFQNMLIEHGLGDFNFKFDDNESYKAAYGEKDGIYCIININDNFERYSVNEFYFFKKNENGNFDSVNYNGYCYFSYANKFYKKLKVVKEGKEEYIINSDFDVFNNELNRNYLDITVFKNIYLDFERLTKLNLFYNAKHHVFKDDRPNKLKFEKGKIKSKSYINQAGYCDRKNGPAIIIYDEDGKLKKEFWYKNNIYYKEDGPAIIEYHSNGKPKLKQFFHSKGKYEHLKTILFNKEGKAIQVEWDKNSRGKFPTYFVIDKDSSGFSRINIGWLNENDNFKEGLGGIDLISGKIDLYFYDSNEDIVEEELKCAIMESNMNEVEKKIIRNIERIQEKEAKTFDRLIKNANKTI